MIRIVEIIDIFINVLFNFSWYRSATVVYCIPACKIWVQVLKDIFVETIYNYHKSYTYKSLDWWPLCEIWIVFTSFKCDRAFLWAFICLPMVDLSVGLYSSAELSFTTFKPLKWYKIYSIIIHQLVCLDKYDPQKYDTAASIHLRYVWGSSFLATIRFPSASSPNGRVLVKYLEALLILGCFKTSSGLSWRFTSSTWPGSKRLIFCYI